MTGSADMANAARRLPLPLVDLALQATPGRRWALRAGSRRLHEFFCGERSPGLPLGVQQFRYKAAMNLFTSIEQAVGDGRISRSARIGLMRSLIGEAVINAPKNVAPFVETHGYEPPGFLVLSPTQRCNLHCEGCCSSSSSKTTSTMTYDTLHRVLEDARDNWGSRLVVISGGEPLLYRSQDKDIFDLFRAFPNVYFLMFTNGTLLNPCVVRAMEEVGNVSPAISVEGFAAETDARRGSGVFVETERAMRLLGEVGVPFGISMTATKRNADTRLSEEVVHHYFDVLGAIHAWIFQYMPIGRGCAVDLMPTPEQRKRLLLRELDLLHNRGLFLVDFPNGGPLSGGCIAAGRSVGYLHVDWNGNVSPCVFMPYAVDNVYKMYQENRTLSSVLEHPVLAGIRDWQRQYSGRDGKAPTQNLFTPCPIRDHHLIGRNILVRCGAKPIDSDAATALADPDYAGHMVQYGHELSSLLDPIWAREIGASDPASRLPDRSPADGASVTEPGGDHGRRRSIVPGLPWHENAH